MSETFTEDELIGLVLSKFKEFKYGELKKFCETHDFPYNRVRNFKTDPKHQKGLLEDLANALGYKIVKKELLYNIEEL